MLNTVNHLKCEQNSHICGFLPSGWKAVHHQSALLWCFYVHLSFQYSTNFQAKEKRLVLCTCVTKGVGSTEICMCTCVHAY